MECPKCRKEISDEVNNCPYCGTKVRAGAESKKKKLSVRRKKSVSGTEKVSKGLSADKLKIAAFGVLGLVVIGVIVVIIMILTASKGEKYADDASQYIGVSVKKLNEETGIHYTDQSEYYGVNSAVVFDHVYESEKSIKAEGISYPRWAVFITDSDVGFITDVTYTDFSIVKRDRRGIKRGERIDLERFSAGTKQNAVLKEINMKPYSINYSQTGLITYTYKYYTKRDNGDEQALLLRVAFNEKGKYEYSTTEILIPENM